MELTKGKKDVFPASDKISGDIRYSANISSFFTLEKVKEYKKGKNASGFSGFCAL